MAYQDDIRELISTRPHFKRLPQDVSASSLATVAGQIADLDQWRATALRTAKGLYTPAEARRYPALFDNVRARTRPSAAERPTLAEDTQRLMASVADASFDLALLAAKRHDWRMALGNVEEAHAALDVSHGQIKRLAGLAGFHALARYMVEGNSPALRQQLADAIANGQDTAGIRVFAARTHVMIGDYKGAHALLASYQGRQTNELRTVYEIIMPQQGKPWIKFPCNVYTYRHELLSAAMLSELSADTRGLSAGEKEQAQRVLHFHTLWNSGNTHLLRGEHVQAVTAYRQAEKLAEAFLHRDVGATSLKDALNHNPVLRAHFRDRYKALTLDELENLDWKRPLVGPAAYRPYSDAAKLVRPADDLEIKWFEKVAAPLITIAYIFIPLAIAEAQKARRQWDYDIAADRPGALVAVAQLLKSHHELKMMCEFIERPFAAMLKAQILIEKGDMQYRMQVKDPSPQVDQNGKELYQGLKAARSYQGAIDGLLPMGQYVNHVRDAIATRRKTYQGLTQVEDADGARSIIHHPTTRALYDAMQHQRARLNLEPGPLDQFALADADKTRQLRRLGYDPLISTVQGSRSRNKSRTAWQRQLTMSSPSGDPFSAQNPQIYALILVAQARLQQLAANMNYLGYSQNYIPPWRFVYLLERARYFANHTRALQNAFLNYLSTAEKEEFSEIQATNAVAQEDQNVAVEEARLEQARQEQEAATAAQQQAELGADNAAVRAGQHLAFDSHMRGLQEESMSWAWLEFWASGGAATVAGFVSGAGIGGSIGGAIGSLGGPAGAVAGGTIVGIVGGIGIGGLVGLITGGGAAYTQVQQKRISMEMQTTQRQLERDNLELARDEALAAANTAGEQQEAADAAVDVANAQLDAAKLRLEHARQMMEYYQNRTTNSELWYRLADHMRGLSWKYLDDAIELAFLAEQAYEFESGDRLDLIRFDYDITNAGEFLGGDFLLSDLDILEHQYLINVTERQQQLRFVVSLARDFPDVLQQLRDYGRAVFPVNLRVIEQRFPGIYNCRISSAHIQPVALMDPTRFAVQLSHLGTGLIRTENAPNRNDALVSNPAPSWCVEADTNWPVKIQVVGPQTEIFTGMSRQEALTESPNQASQQRAGFEGIGAASSWFIDMSMKENRVDPSTLADIVVTFNLTGYHSDELKRSVLDCLPAESAQTLYLSAQANYPDTYYEFHNSGRLSWQVTPFNVPTGLRAERLRNVAIRLLPATQRPQFGRIMAVQMVDFTIAANGNLTVTSPAPQIGKFTIEGLRVTVGVTFAGPVSEAFWRFEEQGDWLPADLAGGDLAYAYAKSGTYTVTLRAIHQSRLREFTYIVSVAATANMTPPVTAYPELNWDNATKTLRIVHKGLEGFGQQIMFWSVADMRGATAQPNVTLSLPQPSNATDRRYTLQFSSIRALTATFFSHQRYVPNAKLTLTGLSEASNRQFDADGDLTSSPADLDGNPISRHVFVGAGEMLPLDTWTLVISKEENPFLRSITSAGSEVIDLSELQDAVLSLEYDAVSIL